MLRGKFGLVLLAAVWLMPCAPAFAAADADTEARIARLEKANAALIDFIRATAHGPAADRLIAQLAVPDSPAPVALAAAAGAPAIAAAPATGPATAGPATAGTPGPGQYASASGDASGTGGAAVFGIAPPISEQLLSHTEWTNTKPLILLRGRQSGDLAARITFGGQAIAMGDWEYSNRASKFDWVMRFPTNGNEVGNHVSELTVHSASLSMTAALTPWMTTYVSMLYNPEQNFGAGTNTTVARNTVTVNSAFVLLGNLRKFPVYAALGKIDVPFGLNDTVSPFSNSWNWHTFAGLANGAELGFVRGGLHLRAMAIEGGAQFRAVNTPVSGTGVPSLVNNYAFDANYTAHLQDLSVMAGASYERGSDYCDPYPAGHFGACHVFNPAWAAYGTATWRRLRVNVDFARTTDPWLASGTPALAPNGKPNPYAASPAAIVSARTIGARYALPVTPQGVDLSFEFSAVHSGAADTPWHRQKQWVLGLAHRYAPGIKGFVEAIHTQGYAPLTFMSGGNFPDGSSWSDAGAISNVGLVGIEAGF